MSTTDSGEGPANAAEIDQLLKASHAFFEGGRAKAITALGALAGRIPPDRLGAVVDRLLEAVSDKSYAVGWPAVDSFAKVAFTIPGPMRPGAAQKMLALASHPKEGTRNRTAKLIGQVSEFIPQEQVPAAMDALAPLLDSGDEATQGNAASSMAALVSRLPADALGPLADKAFAMAGSRHADDRQSAATLLGGIAMRLDAQRFVRTVETLKALLADKNQWVRSKAMYGVRHADQRLSDSQRSDLIQTILANLNGFPRFTRSMAVSQIQALASSLPQSQQEPLVGAMLGLLDDKDSSTRESAADALGFLGKHLPPAALESRLRAPLEKAARDKNERVARAATRALERLNPTKKLPSGADTLPQLLERARSKDFHEQLDANGELIGMAIQGTLPDEARGAVVDHALAEMAKEDQGRGASSSSMSRMTGRSLLAMMQLRGMVPQDKSGQIVIELIRHSSAGTADRRAEAASDLGTFGSTAPPDVARQALARLLDLSRDPDDRVRAAAASGIGDLGPAAMELGSRAAPDRLRELTADTAGEVGFEAALALVKLKHDLAPEVADRTTSSVLHKLRSSERGDRNAGLRAVDVLGVNVPDRRRAEVGAVLVHVCQDPDALARAGAVTSLGIWVVAVSPELHDEAVPVALELMDAREGLLRSSAGRAVVQLIQSFGGEDTEPSFRKLIEKARTTEGEEALFWAVSLAMVEGRVPGALKGEVNAVLEKFPDAREKAKAAEKEMKVAKAL